MLFFNTLLFWALLLFFTPAKSVELLLPTSEQSNPSFLTDISAGFEQVTKTRGLFVSREYVDVGKALSTQPRCFYLDIQGQGIHTVAPGIIQASASAEIRVVVQTTHAPECGEAILVYLSQNHGVQLIRPLHAQSIDLTFEDESQVILVALSNHARAAKPLIRMLRKMARVSNRKPLVQAMLRVMFNQFAARAISNIEAAHTGKPALLWIQRGSTADKTTHKTITAWLQSRLKPGEALLMLGWRQGKLMRQLIGPDFVSDITPGPEQTQVSVALRQIHQQLGITQMVALRAPQPRGFKVVAKTPSLLHERTDAFWRNLGEWMLPAVFQAHLAAVDTLQIVAPGDLVTLPFAALINPVTQHHWVEDFNLSILPDLVALAMVPTWRIEQKTALVIGDPLAPKTEDYHLPNLPGARAEAQAVASFWNTSALVGAAADLPQTLRQLSNVSVLHVAAHGVANVEKPLRGSFLALAGSSAQSSRLTALEILSHDLRKMDLAVMSACQTGLGYQHDRGVIGLARAFYIAGVGRVVMSLWSVDDAATKMLMTTFHRGLRSMPPARALRAAMLETRKHFPDPWQWASFALFGLP